MWFVKTKLALKVFCLSVWYLICVCARAYSYALLDMAGVLYESDLLLIL